MVLGHYAVGFALKKAEPELPLGMLLLGVNLMDILLGILMLSGIEHARFAPAMTGVYPFDFYNFPYSHSFAGGMVLSLLGFLLYRYWPAIKSGSRLRPALIFGAAIFSHFLCDIISHHPDLPIFGNDSRRIGLGLFGSPAGSVALEGMLFILGLYWYRKVMSPSSSRGRTGFVLFIAGLLAVYFWTLIDVTLSVLHLPFSPEKTLALLLFFGNLLFVAIGAMLEKGLMRERQAGDA